MTIHKFYGIFFTTVCLLLSGLEAGATGKRWNVVDEKDSLNISMKAEEATNTEKQEKVADKSSEHLFYADEWIKSWFSRLDINGDNKVELSEFNKTVEPFSKNKEYIKVFEQGNANPDGVLNLFEFKNFVDTTDFLRPERETKQAAPVAEEAYELDPLKLLAGIFAISLLMAAFKLV